MNNSHSIYIINRPYPSPCLPQEEIEECLDMQLDTRTWTTEDYYKPFPAPIKKAT